MCAARLNANEEQLLRLDFYQFHQGQDFVERNLVFREFQPAIVRDVRRGEPDDLPRLSAEVNSVRDQNVRATFEIGEQGKARRPPVEKLNEGRLLLFLEPANDLHAKAVVSEQRISDAENEDVFHSQGLSLGFQPGGRIFRPLIIEDIIPFSRSTSR